MQKRLTALALILFFNLSVIYGQDKPINFGIKTGMNIGKFTPNKNSIDYKYKFGFYAGGFMNISLKEKLEFQPELLFALQGSRVLVKGLNIPNFDFNGNPISNSNTYDFEYEINELTISIPLIVKVFLSNQFYLESGPQIGFIIERSLNSSQQILDGEDDSFIIRESDDSFDFGVSLGLGYKVSERVNLNSRLYSGLIKRDDKIKSFVLNIGIEYNL
ncbi:hypothetical protein pgond44_02458 [Psychroflexus gondwanensis ACAM 44]|jgi:hypothetical protein|uniref:Outer membrane protein beta-barrel domain-containing protein n=1 Tax=Psychroflexus gondwanensis ACAM 44 TaxID=1189619 RepID=N1WSU9_9FLAO|nr:porin family protein [Psychroflexus gondwanensis]EMY82065.1 hypothetical protein pgond44_02458 [Psychroflexus gondwanensis ACAM 44]